MPSYYFSDYDTTPVHFITEEELETRTTTVSRTVVSYSAAVRPAGTKRTTISSEYRLEAGFQPEFTSSINRGIRTLRHQDEPWKIAESAARPIFDVAPAYSVGREWEQICGRSICNNFKFSFQLVLSLKMK
ncbi:MAG: hypothetical protein ACLTR6_15750 [Clostridium fessum]